MAAGKDLYHRTQEELCDALKSKQLSYDDPPEGSFVWLKIPDDRSGVKLMHDTDGLWKVLKAADRKQQNSLVTEVKCHLRLGNSALVLGMKNGGVNTRGIWVEMEYLSLGTLTDLLKSLNEDAIPMSTIKIIIVDVAAAIFYFHLCLVCHRDIKPDNIFIGDNYRFRLGDMDLSYLLNIKRLMSSRCGNLLFGNPAIFMRRIRKYINGMEDAKNVSEEETSIDEEDGEPSAADPTRPSKIPKPVLAAKKLPNYTVVMADIWNLGTIIFHLLGFWNKLQQDVAKKIQESIFTGKTTYTGRAFRDTFLDACFEASRNLPDKTHHIPQELIDVLKINPFVRLALASMDALDNTVEIIDLVIAIYELITPKDLADHNDFMAVYKKKRIASHLGVWTHRHGMGHFLKALVDLQLSGKSPFATAAELIAALDSKQPRNIRLLEDILNAMTARGPVPPKEAGLSTEAHNNLLEEVFTNARKRQTAGADEVSEPPKAGKKSKK